MTTISRKNHIQVPFTTVTGERVQVDEGVWDLLAELRRLGAHTYFSCQGNVDFGGYVLGSHKTMISVIRSMHRAYLNGEYTPAQIQTYFNFCEGYKDFEFFVYFPDCFGRWLRRYQLLHVRKILNGVQGQRQYYSFERDLSNIHGRRVALRWPTTDTARVTDLLTATPR